jgi:hypothetical protein
VVKTGLELLRTPDVDVLTASNGEGEGHDPGRSSCPEIERDLATFEPQAGLEGTTGLRLEPLEPRAPAITE